MENKMFSQIKVAAGLALSLSLFSSCDKSAGSFSLLADSQSFTEQASYSQRKIDVLFVMDNSGSMKSSQDNLAANFPSFISKFIQKGFDFKIAVTTTDAYLGDQFLGKSGCASCVATTAQFFSGVKPAQYVISSANYDLSSTSDIEKLKSVFSSNIKTGVSGSGDERAFSSFKAALNSNLNANFHRKDAYLAIVIVSDEDDFSQSSYTLNESYTNPNLYSVSSYNSYLQTFTGGVSSEDYSVSTISILDSTCLNKLLINAQKISQRYIQLANLTGGSKNSLCDGFDSILDSLSTQILTQAKPIYTLNSYPNVATIIVNIDGTVVPQSSTDGWSYDATANTITINGSTYKPTLGSSVSITFDPDLSKI